MERNNDNKRQKSHISEDFKDQEKSQRKICFMERKRGESYRQIDREIDTNIAGKNERERNLEKQKDKSREMISTITTDDKRWSIHQN